MENKEKICKKLYETLFETAKFIDLKDLRYDRERDIVIAEYENGFTKEINVKGDSGWGVIKDVIKNIA